MTKKFVLVGVLVLVVAAVFYCLKGIGVLTVSKKPVLVFDPKNATYTAYDAQISFLNGYFEKEERIISQDGREYINKITARIFGEPSFGDLNNDGINDAIIIFTQNTGGTGTFYFVSALMNIEGASSSTNSILLGDRIAPQNISIRDGVVEVNYAARGPGESFAAPPSIGVTKRLKLIGGSLEEYKGN